MAIDAVSASRASAAYRREASRMAARQYEMMRADARRDTRIEEAKAMDAARPTPAERTARNGLPGPGMLIDIMV